MFLNGFNMTKESSVAFYLDLLVLAAVCIVVWIHLNRFEHQLFAAIEILFLKSQLCLLKMTFMESACQAKCHVVCGSEIINVEVAQSNFEVVVAETFFLVRSQE